jgi:hypothetical protein
LRRRGLVFFGAASVALTVAAFYTVLAAAEAEILLRGRHAVATVEEVGEERRTRQGLRYPALLRVADTAAWAERPLRVTGGWSAPPVAPRPGDRVEVFVLPDDPPRLVPVSALEGPWHWLASVGFAWIIASAAVWAGLRSARA